jgi:hypothetical protein
MMSGYHLGKLVAPFTGIGIAKHTKVDMIWVAGRSPTLVSHSLRGVATNLKATTLAYLAIVVICKY